MKLILSLVAVLAVASAAIAGPVSIVDYSGRLMSAYDAPMSIDDDLGTGWYSVVGADAWIIYDLGSVMPVTDVTITMLTGNFRKLATAAMSVSIGGVNYTAVGSFDVDAADGAATTFSLGGASAQYVRLDAVMAHYNNWDDIDPSAPTDKAYPANVTDFAISYAEIDFVPEPATLSLLAFGGALMLRRRRA